MNFYRLKFWRFYILSSHFTGVNIPTGRFGVELHFSFYPPLLQSSVLHVLQLLLLPSYCPSSFPPSVLLLRHLLLHPSYLFYSFSFFHPTVLQLLIPVLLVLRLLLLPSYLFYSFSFFRPTVLQLLILPSYLSFIFSSFRSTCTSASPSSFILVIHLLFLPSYLSFSFSSFRPTCPLSSLPSVLLVLYLPSVLLFFILHIFLFPTHPFVNVSFILYSYLSFIIHILVFPSYLTFIFSFFRSSCSLSFIISVLLLQVVLVLHCFLFYQLQSVGCCIVLLIY